MSGAHFVAPLKLWQLSIDVLLTVNAIAATSRRSFASYSTATRQRALARTKRLAVLAVRTKELVGGETIHSISSSALDADTFDE
jgi:hypothetical protein